MNNRDINLDIFRVRFECSYSLSRYGLSKNQVYMDELLIRDTFELFFMGIRPTKNLVPNHDIFSNDPEIESYYRPNKDIDLMVNRYYEIRRDYK